MISSAPWLTSRWRRVDWFGPLDCIQSLPTPTTDQLSGNQQDKCTKYFSCGTIMWSLMLVYFSLWKTPSWWRFPPFYKNALFWEMSGSISLTETKHTFSHASFSMIAPHTGTLVLYCMKVLNACSWSWLHWCRSGHAWNSIAENFFSGRDGNLGFSSRMKSS